MPVTKWMSSLLLIFLFTSYFGLQAQEWIQLNDPPMYKHHNNGFGLGDKAYVLEGTLGAADPGGASNEVWEYTASTDSWVRINDFPGPGRGFAIGDDWNGKYYYGFGGNNNTDFNDLWVFDPADNSFTELPSCPCEGRAHPAFIAHNDKIWMGTGSGANSDLNDWWEYDMITMEWSQKPNFPGNRRHHPFQFAIGDYIYAGGGHVDNWNRYDPATEEWTSIDAYPEGRVAGSQFAFDGYGYLLGGDETDHTHVPYNESFLRYDPEIDEWKELTPPPNGTRWANASFIIEEEVYFFGGIDYDVDRDVSMWKMNLNAINCQPASSLATDALTDVGATLTWEAGPDGDAGLDSLRWRRVGESIWNEVPNAVQPYAISNLEACIEYEFQVSSRCSNFTSFSELHLFTTDGCCLNPELNFITEENAAMIEWPSILAADSYEFRYRITGETNWTDALQVDPNVALSGLEECTEYEVQIKSICDIASIDFSESQFFQTKGCGACIDLDYCPPHEGLSATWNYIEAISIDSYENVSGSNGGYAIFSSADVAPIAVGGTFELGFEPFLSPFFPNGLSFSAWIDYNADGVFAEDEMVVNEVFVSEGIVREIIVPEDAVQGLSRLRVLYGETFPATPCHDEFNSNLGEMEDYCITIVEKGASTEDNFKEAVSVTPNPFHDELIINASENLSRQTKLTIVDALGAVVKTVSQIDQVSTLDLSELAPGIYWVIIESAGQAYRQTTKVVKQ